MAQTSPDSQSVASVQGRMPVDGMQWQWRPGWKVENWSVQLLGLPSAVMQVRGDLQWVGTRQNSKVWPVPFEGLFMWVRGWRLGWFGWRFGRVRAARVGGRVRRRKRRVGCMVEWRGLGEWGRIELRMDSFAMERVGGFGLRW